MQAINLLPKELRRDPTIELKRLLRTALITTLLGVLTLALTSLLLTNYFKEKEIEAIKTEIKTLEATVQKVNSLKKEIEINERRIKVYQGLLDQHIPWPELLKDISFNMPRDMWLTDITASRVTTEVTINTDDKKTKKEKPTTTKKTEVFVTLKGYAPSLSSTGVFLLHLAKISGLQNANLVMAKEIDESKFGTYLLEFEIKAKVKTAEGGKD